MVAAAANMDRQPVETEQLRRKIKVVKDYLPVVPDGLSDSECEGAADWKKEEALGFAQAAVPACQQSVVPHKTNRPNMETHVVETPEYRSR